MNNLRKNVLQILKDNNIRADKSLGQNFLINEKVCSEIINKAEIGLDDTVLEVGAGFGTLTKLLAERAGRVIAVEKSKIMFDILKKETESCNNVEAVNQDILKLNFQEYGLDNASYKLVGAPPYYLTARLFRTFLQSINNSPSSIALLIQKEVAEKISKKEPPFSLINISVSLYGEVYCSGKIDSNVFYPSPSIDSKIISVKNIKKPEVEEDKFFKVVKSGFSSPRKKLLKNLYLGLGMEKSIMKKVLEKTAIDIEKRPGELSLEDWVDLVKNIHKI